MVQHIIQRCALAAMSSPPLTEFETGLLRRDGELIMRNFIPLTAQIFIWSMFDHSIFSPLRLTARLNAAIYVVIAYKAVRILWCVGFCLRLQSQQLKNLEF